MHCCFIDESGDSGTFSKDDPLANPFFVVCGLIINSSCIHPFTIDFLKIKSRYFPNHFRSSGHFLDRILIEIKGGDLRKDLRETDRRRRQQAIGFLDACVSLLERYRVRLLGKGIIKAFGRKNSDPEFYRASLLHLCHHFEHFLKSEGDIGVVIADSRRKAQNWESAHSVFTQLHKSGGSAFPSLPLDIVFSPSNNSAMIQMSDIVCSGLIFPMMADAYNLHLFEAGNIHNCPAYFHIRMRYKDRVKRLQYLHIEDGFWRGGISVWDMTGLRRNSGLLFRDLLPALLEQHWA